MDNYKHIVIKFDHAQQPKFEEKKGKYSYVEFGKNNDYPNYLLSLYNESPKHGAIVKSKCTYIYGKGFEDAGTANSRGETWNQIVKKCIKDDELYRGYYLQVIWNRIGQIAEVYHIDFAKVRVNKDLSLYYVKNDWSDFKEKPREYPAFNMNDKYGSQIYFKREYNPLSEVYPLPAYYQGLNYIESDIKVSRHILGNANQGFVGSTLINLNNGDPVNEEHKGEVERGLLKKFTGDEGKRLVIMFNKSKDNAAEIINLGNTMLTKEDFTNVNNLITNEIMICHQVVSPTLFGVKVEGQLGSRNEIREAYEVFNNVYVQERQMEYNEIFTQFRNLKGEAGEFYLQPVEPLKFEFSEAIMAANLTQNEIRELMGREPLESNAITADGSQALPGELPQQVEQKANEAIRNLSGRQYQNVMRIVRQFGNGKLSKAQATLMLKNGFGFSDSDVDTFLGIDDNPLTEDEVQKFSLTEDERLILEFENCGEEKKNYTEVARESYREYFADNLTQAQADILTLITKDENITPQVIARTLKLDTDLVIDIIDDFIEREIIKSVPSKINAEPTYKVLKPASELPGKQSKVTTLVIRYSYEGPEDSKNRPFCAKLLELSKRKTWSRSDIESISERVGYSVWDRRGGWYTQPNGEHREYCRHRWTSKLMKKKDE
jgi:DNA-binding MarR family transcriptional regulator